MNEFQREKLQMGYIAYDDPDRPYFVAFWYDHAKDTVPQDAPIYEVEFRTETMSRDMQQAEAHKLLPTDAQLKNTIELPGLPSQWEEHFYSVSLVARYPSEAWWDDANPQSLFRPGKIRIIYTEDVSYHAWVSIFAAVHLPPRPTPTDAPPPTPTPPPPTEPVPTPGPTGPVQPMPIPTR